MIYEVRTYDLKPGTVAQFEEAFGEALPYRQEYSPLAAFWHVDIGPLNQVIHVWPYDSLDERERIRGVQRHSLAAPQQRSHLEHELGDLVSRPLHASHGWRPKAGRYLRDAYLHL